MRVLMLSDKESQGGAAVAATRLARGLVQEGHEVVRAVASSTDSPSGWQTRELRLAHWQHAVLRAGGWFCRPKNREPWRDRHRQSLLTAQLARLLAVVRPQVINAHNLHGAAGEGWTAAVIGVCAEWAPTVWTLHDMWSFTGRCAYSYECRRFVEGCSAQCPTPTEYPPLRPEEIAPAWQDRRRILSEHTSLCAVSPSRWLAARARKGLWCGHAVHTIPNGIPLSVYRPGSRQEARATLGLEPRGPVVLAVAEDLTDRRKGMSLFLDSLRQANTRPLTVLTLGAGAVKLAQPDVEVHELGLVADHGTLVSAYNAAELLVHPALADNLPNVVIEALACGTPVCAFAVGGLPELVRPGQTGWLAPEVSSAALAETMDVALETIMLGGDLRESCREAAVSEYGDTLQAQRYSALFAGVAADATPAPAPEA